MRPAPLALRVLSYNIRHGEGRDGRIDLPRLATVMAGLEPDLVALQEVDRGTVRSGGVDQLAELAGVLGMHAEFGKALDFDGGGYGVAVLSRWAIRGRENHPLPSSDHREPRTALTVRLQAGDDGPWLRFTSTHLDSGRSEDRLPQARYLNQLLVSHGGEPCILAGDLNARLGSDEMQSFDGHWTNALAAALPEPEGRSRRRGPRGDYVLVRPVERWRVVETLIVDERDASDHRPVLTLLECR